MDYNTAELRAIPTNIITGFLGVGKTSVILHLLKNKPLNERWAVLVNEFGEIGVDGNLLVGQYSELQGVFIREVAGGCMCCAAGVPMQVALNQLLTRAKPHRLLIEPTGLGHPKEVLQLLSAKHYQTVLSLQKTLTLVDARNLSNERYTTHDTFNQQIEIADIVIGNKLDLYQSDDKARLKAYVRKHGRPNTEVIFSKHAEVEFSLLKGKIVSQIFPLHHHDKNDKNDKKQLAADNLMPDCGFIKAINQGEGYISIGWIFLSDKIFDYQKLSLFLKGISTQRVKAVFITNYGAFSYNYTADGITQKELNKCRESRIEIISEYLDDGLEAQLMACMM
ncbi:MAG: G3E family GTPase [Psychrobacter glaciei]|jgi:G3E family GTPase|tara:strand:- start:1842 stop:2849 length:1008 start_codon:yes stop_codon:yes gene_type:complete